MSSLDSSMSGANGKSGLSLVLNITNFNNYSSDDINQLTNEVNLSYTTRSISLTFSKNRCKNDIKTAHTHKNVRCLIMFLQKLSYPVWSGLFFILKSHST